MIKKIIIYTILFFVIYNLGLIFFKPERLVPQSNYDLNVVKAERYLQEQEHIDYVVVGSSLGNRIESELFSNNIYFLTLSGMSSLDGLEVIKHSDKLPKIIFIETNVIDRSSNFDFQEDALSPVVLGLQGIVPSVLKENKPTSLLHKPFSYVLYGIRNQFDTSEDVVKSIVPTSTSESKSSSATDTISKVKGQNPTLNRNSQSASKAHFIQQKDKMEEGISEKVLKPQMEKLKSYVRYFQMNDVRIVFFDMPIDKTLETLKKPQEIRNAFWQEFPSESYHYIKAPQGFSVTSMDGIHLTGKSIHEFSVYFKTELTRLSNL